MYIRMYKSKWLVLKILIIILIIQYFKFLLIKDLD